METVDYRNKIEELRDTLNRAIKTGYNAKDAKLLLKIKMDDICTQCVVSNVGNCGCMCGRICFIENKYNLYLDIIDQLLD